MNKTKEAINEFLHKSGHNDTTVHEKVAPAVVNENITKARHEEETTAIDREVHQHHHHTTVQPVKDREVLPEQHQSQIAGVETREHRHGNDEAIRARLEQEAAQFKNTRSEGAVKETHSVAPTVAGEHVHHHVHETIQPIIQKEVIQPSVVHTTVPIHEIHHNEAKHHAASALPAVSMADFKKQGGVLSGREERHDRFEGEPKGVTSALGGSAGGSGSGIGSDQQQTTAGPHGNLGNKLDPRVDSDMDRSRNTGANSGAGYTGTNTGSEIGSSGTRSGYDNTTTTGSTDGTANTTKPSLLDRLNPMKDTNQDGKRDMMD